MEFDRRTNPSRRNANRELARAECAQRQPVVRSLPSRLQIDVTGRCNMRCPACYLTIGGKAGGGHLEPEVFARLRTVFPLVEKVTLYGTGEPLVAPHFEDYFREVSEIVPETYFTTNGTLLTARVSQLLVQHRLTYLSVSFSAADRVSFARIHGADYFDRIVANVKRLNEIKRAHGSRYPMLRISYVAARNTLDQFAAVVRLAHELGCESGVATSYLVAFDESQLPFIAPGAEAEFQQAYREACRVGADLGIPVEFKALAPGELADLACTRPWDSAFIRFDGAVFVCTESTSHPLGSLREASFEEIWYGRLATAFREAHAVDPHLCCRYCNQCQNKRSGDLFAHLGGRLWHDEVARLGERAV